MKKILIIIATLCAGTFYTQAQNTLALSLQQAKEQGLKNRYDVQANAYNIAIAENNTRQKKDDWLPDINGMANIHYNTQIQATLIPAGFGGLTEPQLIALGARNVSIFGLDLNQAIFKPANNTNIKIARNNTALQKEKNIQYETDIKTQIALAYLNVQLKQLQLKIATDNEQRYKDYYAVADATFKAGSLLENDVLKAKLDLENAEATTAAAKQQVTLAVKNLKYQINVPETTALVLTDSLTDGEAETATGDEMNRTEIKQLLIKQQNNSLATRKIMMDNLPVISLHANYSGQFLGDRFNYSDSKWWTSFNYVELRMNIPITGILKNKTDLREAKFQTQQTDMLLQQKIADVHYEIQQTNTELNNAIQNRMTAKNNYSLSKTIYATQQQQYKFGVLLYSNLLDIERSLSTSEQNYVKAIYDYMVAKINYERAEGIL